jgi:DNA-binding SARP family transcriptional activator
MDFRILGPLEAVDGGMAFAPGGPKQRAVLAVLLLHANQVVTSDRLIDQVWGDEAPETVKTVLQGAVSNLRKLLGPETIGTRPGGYQLVLGSHGFDLHRFEALLAEAREAPGPAEASARLREALGLWRGPALSDFAYEPFAQTAILRLEELRVGALEARIDADLALGRHGELVGELEALVTEHPLRERLRAQLMLALYRCGRQAEALEAYQSARRALVDELGIDPTQTLQELERAILRQDPTLDLVRPAVPAEQPAATSAPERALLVVAQEVGVLDAALVLAAPLAARPPREVILALLVADAGDLTQATRALHERRDRLVSGGVSARGAAFTSGDRGSDAARLASEQHVDLLVLGIPTAVLESQPLSDDLAEVMLGAPCDVGLLVVRDGARSPGPDAPVVVPFGGAEHEWAAAEVGAWIAGAVDAPLQLLGTTADPERGQRDASRLLAAASLSIQRVSGVSAEPLIVRPGAEAVVEAATEAGLVVLGLSDRWRQEGLGAARLHIARAARPPVLLVRGGVRPGGIAPRESMTRFTWSLAAGSKT